MPKLNTVLPTSILKILQSYPYRSYVVAYSGGLDSHVLLHALAKLKNTYQLDNIRAIHIDHGLQKASGLWSKHCKKTAVTLNISCEIITLNLQINEGESIESVAREARYQALESALQPNEMLLTAHHQDDQAETVLLQLFRGAGVNGLAAMPESKPFAQSLLVRPLLSVSQQQLREYAEQQQLDYIDDPSNFDTDFDRNFLRHEVIPLLQTRWKGIHKNLNRVAQLQAEAKYLVESSLQADLGLLLDSNKALSINNLLLFCEVKQKAIIRLWLKQLGFKMPSEIKLKHIISDVIHAKQDANPCVDWDNVEVRRFRNYLYAVEKLVNFDATAIIPWNANQPLRITSIGKTLKPEQLGEWQTSCQRSNQVTVRFRQGGERIYLPGHQQSTSLKKLMQAAKIPPWERSRIPLIYLENMLIMAYPYWSSKK